LSPFLDAGTACFILKSKLDRRVGNGCLGGFMRIQKQRVDMAPGAA
jgi:hypothetical protein